MDSPFLDPQRWIDNTELAATVDQIGYEVSPGHCLIVPKRIIPTLWDMTEEEWVHVKILLDRAKVRLDATLQPNGYNVGANCGEAAGQTVMHAHIHLIPRHWGDHPNPRGGVRAVIPDKADWIRVRPARPLNLEGVSVEVITPSPGTPVA